jgi:hypothetical protein
MTEVADGLMVHSFTTVDYLRETTLSGELTSA